MKDYPYPSTSLAPWTVLIHPCSWKDLTALMFLLWLLPDNLTDQEQLALTIRGAFLGISDPRGSRD